MIFRTIQHTTPRYDLGNTSAGSISILQSIFLFVGISLLPVYLWGSGGMQLSHFSLSIAIGLLFARSKLTIRSQDLVLLAFLVFVFFREALAYAAGQNIRTLMSPLHFLFSILVFKVFSEWVVRNPRNINYFKLALLVSITIAIFGVFLLGYSLTVDQEGGRAVGTFNNPNQLGYFAVCSFSLLVCLYFRGVVKFGFFSIFVVFCIFLAITSLSRAAIVGMAVSLILLGVTLNRNVVGYVVGSVVVTLISSVLYYLYLQGTFDQLSLVRRLNRGVVLTSENLQDRGYYLIDIAGFKEWIVGYGTEMVRSINGHEVHSTLIGVLINYGIFAFLLFITFLVLCFKGFVGQFGVMRALVIMSPPMLYGLTHNGIRFTIFWLLLAFAFSTSELPRSKRVLHK